MRKVLIILALFGLFNCVEQISFEAEAEVGVLVVDGSFSTGLDSSEVLLLRTDILGKRVFPPETGASITIFDNQGKSENYEEITAGLYRLPGRTVWAQPGGTYYLEIQLANGKRYQSKPETIFTGPAMESLSFNVTIEDIVVDEIREVERTFFNLFVNGTVIGRPDETFLRWDVEHVYAVGEIVCHPLHIIKTCYITPPINPNALFLLDGSGLSPGASYSEQVVKQNVDYAFGQAASFYVSQRALTKEAFQYWQDVDQIVNNVGNIFDAPPAAIPGNIFSVDDPTEQVLGYFSAFDEQKKLAFIRPSDLGEFRELPFCGLPGLEPEPLPDPCCNCLRLEFSSTLRPSYWP